VIKLLNQPVELTLTSTWALNHWSVFHEFENATYVQCPGGFRVINDRVCPEKVYTPLDCFPSSVLNRIAQFLTIPEMASVSVTSHKFSTITASNDAWQPLYESLKRQSHQRPKSDESLLGNVFQQSWPVSTPIDGYYKMACCLFLASTSSLSTFVRKFLQCASFPKSVESCPRCHEKSELIATGVTSSTTLSNYEVGKSWCSS